MKKVIKEMIDHNKKFVADKKYESFHADKRPAKKVAIVTCMDCRLVTLLPAALNIHNGDVAMIKNGGGIIRDPYSDAVRSLFVSIYGLGVTEVMIIGHTNCGVQGLTANAMIEAMKKKGIPDAAITKAKKENPDLMNWLEGFPEVDDIVRQSVEVLKDHPLMTDKVHVGGYVMDIETGELRTVVK